MNVERSWMRATRRAARAISLAALAAVCLTLAACARRPASEIKPGQPGEMRLVYQHSKAPAAGLRVTQILSATAEEKIETSDREGRVRLYPEAAVTIVDPQADGCLLASFRTENRIAASMTIPEAVRIAGRVPAERLKDLRLQIGFGQRITAGQRFRNLFDRALAPNDEENRPFGITLPPSSSSWRETTVDANGAFTSAWFPAAERPMIAAWNGAGDVAVEDVPFARVTARATLDAPPLRFVQTRSLDIRFTAHPGAVAAAPPMPPAPTASDVAAGKDPLAAAGPMTAAHVYLRDARGRREDREFIARYVSVLDRIDARTFTFAAGMRPFSIAPGETTLQYLPPWTDVDLRVMDAIVSDAHDLSLPLRDTSTRLDVRGEQLLPQAGGTTLPLHGTVVSERAYTPIAGATVVFSCYPDKLETTTDRFGHFVIPKACVGRESTLFVSHREGQSAPVQATRTHTHRAGAVERVVITLPERKAPFAAARPGGAGVGIGLSAAAAAISPRLLPLPRSPFWTAGLPIPPDAAYWVGGDEDGTPDVMVYRPEFPYAIVPVVGAFWVQPQQLKIQVMVTETGGFDLWLSISPCYAFVQKNQWFNAGVAREVTLIPVGNSTFATQVAMFRYPGGQGPVAPGTAVYFVDTISELDPIEVDADRNGIAWMETCNWPHALIFVGDRTQGCFENIINLNQAGVGLGQLGACGQF